MQKAVSIMKGETRRQEILGYIKNSSGPVSGTELAGKFLVSRQVIVQDIALLRMANKEIVATNRGYLVNTPVAKCRTFPVYHEYDEIMDELYTIVDLGGSVVDVFVEHKVYGQIGAELKIHSRRDVEEFIKEIHTGKSSPLMNVTSGYHYHTVEADSEKALDLVEKALKEKHYLVE